MAEWKPVAILPNLELENSIGNEKVALVNWDDKRLHKIAEIRPNMSKFICQFTDNFGVQIKTTTLIFRTDTEEEKPSSEMLSSFRNVVAFSILPRIYAIRAQNSSHTSRFLYSDTFSFYPWMMDRNDEYLIFQPETACKLNLLENFKGQDSPEVYHQDIRNFDVNEIMLKFLLGKWTEYFYAKTDVNQKNIALFRSLNMAYNAAKLPSSDFTNLYDIGRMLSIWVSAFEILAYSEEENRSGIKQVFKMLENAP